MNDIANTELVSETELPVVDGSETAHEEAPVEIFVTEDTANHVAL